MEVFQRRVQVLVADFSRGPVASVDLGLRKVGRTIVGPFALAPVTHLHRTAQAELAEGDIDQYLSNVGIDTARVLAALCGRCSAWAGWLVVARSRPFPLFQGVSYSPSRASVQHLRTARTRQVQPC